VESGEADGLCGTWETIKVSNAEWLSANPPFARVIVKSKPQPDGDLQDVPLMSQFLQTEEGRQIFAMAMAPQTIGFHYATAPGTPPARLKALRIAVLQAWNDPEFQADAAKSQALPFPQDYQTVERLVNEVISSPPDTLKRAKDILGIQ